LRRDEKTLSLCEGRIKVTIHFDGQNGFAVSISCLNRTESNFRANILLVVPFFDGSDSLIFGSLIIDTCVIGKNCEKGISATLIDRYYKIGDWFGYV
jgi:hypothetical protein